MVHTIAKVFLVGCLAFIIGGTPALAVNGNQVMGVGAYQEGIGGAVTAAPFDTTTIITNPAGITMIGDRFDFGAALFSPKRTVDYSSTGGESSNGGSDMYMLPSLGVSSAIDNDLFVGFAMAVTAGMGADFGPMSAGAMGTSRQFSQQQFWKMSPTIAKKVNDQLSIGGSLNIDYQQIQLRSTYASAAGTGGINATTAEGSMGYGFTVGALYDVNEMVTVGAAYISRQRMGDMKYRLGSGDVALIDPATGSGVMSTGGTYTLAMDFPSQYSFGVSLRPVDRLTVNIDYKKINLSESYETVEMGGDFAVVAAGAPTGDMVSSGELHFGWEDISVIAIGAQYEVTTGLWLRAGYNVSDAPVTEDFAFANTALPAVVKTHYSVGATASIGDKWQAHFSYVTQPTEEVTDSTYGTIIKLGGSSMTFGFSRLF